MIGYSSTAQLLIVKLIVAALWGKKIVPNFFVAFFNMSRKTTMPKFSMLEVSFINYSKLLSYCFVTFF